MTNRPRRISSRSATRQHAFRSCRPGRTNPILLSPSSRGLLLLQRVRDESHRFAIEYQRAFLAGKQVEVNDPDYQGQALITVAVE